MPVRIFHNENKTLKETTDAAGLQQNQWMVEQDSR